MKNKELTAFFENIKSFVAEKSDFAIQLHGCQILDFIDLSENESLIVKNAVASRSFEFSAGRFCAKKCLSNYGIQHCEILKGSLGEPIWPEGYTGSITHHNNIALALVSPTTKYRAIGIDLTSLSEHLGDSSLLMSTDEKALMSDMLADGNTELLIFCMKEAAIKICSPILNDYIEFTDLRLQQGPQDGLIIRHPSIERDINIVWHVSHGLIFSVGFFS